MREVETVAEVNCLPFLPRGDIEESGSPDVKVRVAGLGSAAHCGNISEIASEKSAEADGKHAAVTVFFAVCEDNAVFAESLFNRINNSRCLFCRR